MVLRLAFLALAFLAVVRALTFLAAGLVLLAFFRVVTASVTERRSAGFSGFVAGAAAAIDAGRPRLRPSPIVFANWDRRSE
jgi:hypothetical protein